MTQEHDRPPQDKQCPPEISKLLLQILLTIRLGWICHKRPEIKISLGFQGQCFQTCGKGGPFLKCVFMQPPESAAIRAPQGRSRARLGCHFGFRDKCSLPFAGGTELLPAIKALKSNSSLPRECNLLPPVIKAPLVAAVLPAQPSSSTARMACSCSSSLAPGLQHTTPSATPVQLGMHLCSELERGISPA